MAKISTYPEVVPPALDDLVIGTDVSDSNATKNFLVEDLVELSANYAYKSYAVFFSQSGTNDPVITELYNTIGPISWERSSAGNFTGSATAGTFPSNKTFFPNKQFCRIYGGGEARNVYMSTAGDSLIAISQYNESSVGVDSLNFHLEIRVYN